MAEATLFVTDDMLDPDFYDLSDQLTPIATTTTVTYRFDEGGGDFDRGIYQGSFVLSSNPSLPIAGGTVTTHEFRVEADVLEYRITGLDHAALQVQTFHASEDGLGLQQFLLDGDDTVTGTGGADRLAGWAGGDRLFGQGGDDELVGHGGGDRLFGGAGADTLRGGNGRDTLRGEDQADRLFGDGGDDLLYGNLGGDRLFGGAGADTLRGGGGRDTLRGEGQADRLFGEGGPDRLEGGLGGDRLVGGGGNDRLFGNAGSDRLEGGGGDDRLTGGGGSDRFVFADVFGDDTLVDFDALSGAEKIDLSAVGAITDFADLQANHLSEIAGTVTISDGADTISLLGVSLADLDGSDFVF